MSFTVGGGRGIGVTQTGSAPRLSLLVVVGALVVHCGGRHRIRRCCGGGRDNDGKHGGPVPHPSLLVVVGVMMVHIWDRYHISHCW